MRAPQTPGAAVARETGFFARQKTAGRIRIRQGRQETREGSSVDLKSISCAACGILRTPHKVHSSTVDRYFDQERTQGAPRNKWIRGSVRPGGLLMLRPPRVQLSAIQGKT